MGEITYQKLVFNKEDILNLYLDNGWTTYTDKPNILFNGIKNSLYIRGAYDGSKLVGLIRVVGDGNTIVYIQDILVLKDYQSKGIGSKLILYITKKYEAVRQICLMTDVGISQKNFYEKNGFKEYNDLKLRGFVLDK